MYNCVHYIKAITMYSKTISTVLVLEACGIKSSITWQYINR